MGRAGSILWLLGHELRLDFRRRAEARGGRRWFALVMVIGAPILLAAFVGVPLGLALRDSGSALGPQANLVAAASLAGIFMMMLSQALSAVVDALHERSDLDLLFSSPLNPLRIVAVRALAIAFSAFTIFGFLSAGPLLVIAAMGQPRWLAVLPTLFGAALAATGVALALSLALIKLIGPRRTRLFGHLLSVLLGSAFFLVTQVSALTDPFARARWLSDAATMELADAPWVSAAFRAFSGEPLALGLLTAAQLSVFALGVALAGPRFAALYATAAGVAHGAASPASPLKPFRPGAFQASLRKELRLLWRDSALLPQILLRMVYLAPLGLLVVRYGAEANLTALPATIMALTLMSHQLAGSLAWLAVSAEDAPELLASAPASERLVTRAKIAAAALVVGAVVGPVSLALLAFAPLQALIAFAGCAAATASAALLNVWWRRPGKRTAFRDRASAPIYVTVAELMLGLLISGSAGLLAAGERAGAIPAAVAALALLALRPWRQKPEPPKRRSPTQS